MMVLPAWRCCSQSVIRPDNNGDCVTDEEELVHAQGEVDIIFSPKCLDPTPFERGVREENVSWMLIEQEMEEAEANTTSPDSVSYMEAPATGSGGKSEPYAHKLVRISIY